MVLCSAKNCSSFSFLLAFFIYFFILVCPILFQFCFLIAMTAMDFEMMLERKLQPLVTSLDTLTKSVDFMSRKYDKLLTARRRRAVLAGGSVFFFKPRSGFLLCLRFFFSFVGYESQTSVDDVIISQLQAFLSSFRLIPPQEGFVKLAS